MADLREHGRTRLLDGMTFQSHAGHILAKGILCPSASAVLQREPRKMPLLGTDLARNARRTRGLNNFRGLSGSSLIRIIGALKGVLIPGLLLVGLAGLGRIQGLPSALSKTAIAGSLI